MIICLSFAPNDYLNEQANKIRGREKYFCEGEF